MGYVENAFNSAESSDEWKLVYHSMVKSHYAALGKVLCASKMLHDQFMDLYSAFKSGIKNLSSMLNAPK
jgi:hypothetical protein